MIGGWNLRFPPDPLESVVKCFSSDNASYQIHHFCDSSQEAYGPLLGWVDFLFFISKSCLAPFFKEKTIPRLELTADTVSVRLNKILTKELELPFNGFTFWTDSMTVIRYIANELKRFHTYVANRIAVREDSNLPHWKYIITASPIPIDEASPGVTANMFIRNGRWGEEPNFLSSLEPELEDCTQEYAIRQNLSLPLGLLTKKQHLFQEKMATSSVFDKCFLGSLKISIPSFAAGAPEMVPPKEKTHYWRHGYCRWWINAQEYMAIGLITDFFF